MAKVERFEDLICWQKARELVNMVYEVTRTAPLAKDYKLRDQLRDAAVSSMSNIAEGFARFHKKDFIRFLDISQSSAAEVRSLMYVVLDQKYLLPENVKPVQDKSDECRKTTLALLRHVNQTLSANVSVVRESMPAYGNLEEFNFWELPNEFIAPNAPSPTHQNTKTQ